MVKFGLDLAICGIIKYIEGYSLTPRSKKDRNNDNSKEAVALKLLPLLKIIDYKLCTWPYTFIRSSTIVDFFSTNYKIYIHTIRINCIEVYGMLNYIAILPIQSN